ncbi:MAG: hypothetical protein ACJ74Y_10575 [Bryobacteraceae bacterium]
MKLLPILPICLGLFASSAVNCQVGTPSVGYVRYPTDGVRGIYGLEGNYIVAGTVAAEAKAASFSEAGGLIFSPGSLTLADSHFATVASTEVSDSDAILRLDGDLNTAIAWLPMGHLLVHWNGQSFVTIPVAEGSIADGATSVRKLDANTASLLVPKPDTTVVRYVVSLRTGQLKSSTTVPGASGYAFENGNRILCFKDGRLSVFTQTGETLQVLPVAADGDLLIEQASNECLHLGTRTPGEDWLLHLGDGLFHLYRLPAPRRVAGPVTESAQ